MQILPLDDEVNHGLIQLESDCGSSEERGDIAKLNECRISWGEAGIERRIKLPSLPCGDLRAADGSHPFYSKRAVTLRHGTNIPYFILTTSTNWIAKNSASTYALYSCPHDAHSGLMEFDMWVTSFCSFGGIEPADTRASSNRISVSPNW